MYCQANFNRVQCYAQIIRAGKLEARPFFFSNFKGTPSQEEHKTNFSGLKISKMALSGQSDATTPFQQSAILSVTLTLTFRSLSILESQFSGVKPSYGARATADCNIPELMKFR
jgi:hypothetical protein